MSIKPLAIAIITIALLCAAASSVRAHGLPGEPFVIAAHFLETASPDTRYEFGEDGDGFVLSWPVAYSFWEDHSVYGPGLRAEAIVEPQITLYRQDAQAIRGAAFGRFHLWDRGGFGGFVDAGYVVGEDGHGPAAGGGIALGEFDLWMLGVGSRVSYVDGAPRVDVGLDVRFWLGDL